MTAEEKLKAIVRELRACREELNADLAIPLNCEKADALEKKATILQGLVEVYRAAEVVPVVVRDRNTNTVYLKKTPLFGGKKVKDVIAEVFAEGKVIKATRNVLELV